jgi:hypothetical protein
LNGPAPGLGVTVERWRGGRGSIDPLSGQARVLACPLKVGLGSAAAKKARLSGR